MELVRRSVSRGAGTGRRPYISLYRSLLLLEGRARRRRPERGRMTPRTRSTCRPRPNGGTNEA